MASSAVDTLNSESVGEEDMKIAYSADLRYVGQFNEVEVAASDSGKLDQPLLEQMCQAFHDRHDGLYGYSMEGAPLELINLRVSGSGMTEKPNLESYSKSKENVESAKIGERQAYFDGEFTQTSVYDGMKLENSMGLVGPAIVVQPTTTIVVPPGFALLCDEFNNYLMFPEEGNVDELCKSLQ
jgi:N-methylhydantoinase A